MLTLWYWPLGPGLDEMFHPWDISFRCKLVIAFHSEALRWPQPKRLCLWPLTGTLEVQPNMDDSHDPNIPWGVGPFSVLPGSCRLTDMSLSKPFGEGYHSQRLLQHSRSSGPKPPACLVPTWSSTIPQSEEVTDVPAIHPSLTDISTLIPTI